MQKNKLNLLIYGIDLLNSYKTVVSHLKLTKTLFLPQFVGERATLFSCEVVVLLIVNFCSLKSFCFSE